MRKVIQIAISESETDNDQWALCNDGTIWRFFFGTPIYEEIPATPERNYSSRKKVGETPAHWKIMPNVPQDEINE